MLKTELCATYLKIYTNKTLESLIAKKKKFKISIIKLQSCNSLMKINFLINNQKRNSYREQTDGCKIGGGGR